jgi:hypothetical protein
MVFSVSWYSMPYFNTHLLGYGLPRVITQNDTVPNLDPVGVLRVGQKLGVSLWPLPRLASHHVQNQAVIRNPQTGGQPFLDSIGGFVPYLPLQTILFWAAYPVRDLDGNRRVITQLEANPLAPAP